MRVESFRKLRDAESVRKSWIDLVCERNREKCETDWKKKKSVEGRGIERINN